MPTKSAPKTVATNAVAKPARKGTARTSAGPASPVRSRKLSKSEAKSGTAKLGTPKARRAAAKPAPKSSARVAPRVAKSADPKLLATVRKARAKGTTWNDISAATGVPLGTLARLRKANGGRDGFLG